MSAEPLGADARRQPRYRTDLEARLCGTRVEVRNLAPAGAQVACNAMFFQFLRPKLARRPVELEVTLSGRLLRLHCAVVYVNEHDDEMLVGLRLSVHDGDDPAAFRAFVAQRANAQPPLG